MKKSKKPLVNCFRAALDFLGSLDFWNFPQKKFYNTENLSEIIPTLTFFCVNVC